MKIYNVKENGIYYKNNQNHYNHKINYYQSKMKDKKLK
jgi:hypothetical protein